MSRTFNIFSADEWESENDREGYRHRVTAFGRRLGAKLLGASLYELPAGEKTWPYHYEQGCEEWLLVVAGKPTLRSPDGEQALEPGAVVVFPEGPAGAHQVINNTAEPVRVVLFSSKSRRQPRGPGWTASPTRLAGWPYGDATDSLPPSVTSPMPSPRRRSR